MGSFLFIGFVEKGIKIFPQGKNVTLNRPTTPKIVLVAGVAVFYLSLLHFKELLGNVQSTGIGSCIRMTTRGLEGKVVHLQQLSVKTHDGLVREG